MNNYEKIKNMSIKNTSIYDMAKLLVSCEHCMYELCENEHCKKCINNAKKMLLKELKND